MATNAFCSDESLRIAELLGCHPKSAPVLDKDPHCRLGYCLLNDHVHSEALHPECTACILNSHKKCVTTLIKIGCDVWSMKNTLDFGLEGKQKQLFEQLQGGGNNPLLQAMMGMGAGEGGMGDGMAMPGEVVWRSCQNLEVKKVLAEGEWQRTRASQRAGAPEPGATSSSTTNPTDGGYKAKNRIGYTAKSARGKK